MECAVFQCDSICPASILNYHETKNYPLNCNNVAAKHVYFVQRRMSAECETHQPTTLIPLIPSYFQQPAIFIFQRAPPFGSQHTPEAFNESGKFADQWNVSYALCGGRGDLFRRSHSVCILLLFFVFLPRLRNGCYLYKKRTASVAHEP